MPILLLLALGAAALALAGKSEPPKPPAPDLPPFPPPGTIGPPPPPAPAPSSGKPVSEPLTPLEAQGMGGVRTGMITAEATAEAIGKQFVAGMAAYWASPQGKADIEKRVATDAEIAECLSEIPQSVAAIVKGKLAAAMAGTLPLSTVIDLGRQLSAMGYAKANQCFMSSAIRLARDEKQKAELKALVEQFKAAGF